MQNHDFNSDLILEKLRFHLYLKNHCRRSQLSAPV